MSIEMFRINSDGAGWVDFSELTSSELLDIELAIVTKAEVKVNCYFCHKNIPSGTGNCCANCKNKKGAVYLGN